MITGKLSEFLIHSERYWPDGWLFLPRQEAWTLDSDAAIMEFLDVPDEELEADEDADLPSYARKNGLMETLEAQLLNAIVQNTRMQLPDATPEQLLEAFLHYWENDAYKDFGRLYETPNE